MRIAVLESKFENLKAIVLQLFYQHGEINPKVKTCTRQKMTTNKKALNKDHAWKIQEKYTGLPHGWIQWKGTNVCMDVYCACGHHSHIDAKFAPELDDD
jgi:hypothetical protein